MWGGADREAKQAIFEREQLKKLVNDELQSYGLLLSVKVNARTARGWGNEKQFVLYGQAVKGAWLSREELHVGEFKYCCIKAAELLDKMDASQIPDTATGND